MSLTLELLVRLRQRIYIAMASASPFAVQAFKEWASHIEQNLNERQMQFFALSNLTADSVLNAAACRVFATYVQKQGTSTAAYYQVIDDAANSNTDSEKRIVLGLVEKSVESFAFYPNGLLMSNGVVVGSYTTPNGHTASTSGDGPNGFAILGNQ